MLTAGRTHFARTNNVCNNSKEIKDFIKKKNGRARRTVDLSGLSRAGRHESHHTRSAAEIVKTVPAGKLKSTLDSVDGYHGWSWPRRTVTSWVKIRLYTENSW